MRTALVFGYLLIFGTMACKKTQVNTRPIVHAGNDTTISSGKIELQGSATDRESNSLYFEWKKIEGRAGEIFESPKEAATKVSQLKIGVYGFELRASDAGGLSGMDTVTVTVMPRPNENDSNTIVIDSLWMWGCGLKVENIHSYLPQNRTFEFYIRDSHLHPDWRILNSQEYEIINNTLIIRFNYDCIGYSGEPYSIKIELL